MDSGLNASRDWASPSPGRDSSARPGRDLNVAARVRSTEAEGPGRRYALWVQGCPLRCPGCCNPHFLAFETARIMPVDEVAREMLDSRGIEGVTFLGGEPFSQAEALAAVARRCRDAGLSVMVFSGHTLQHLRRGAEPGWGELLEATDLLVDGPYLRQRHSTGRRWIGSDNQRVHFLTERYADLDDGAGGLDPGPNTLELRLVGTELTINGFPHPDVSRLLSRKAGPKARSTGASES